ncbi:hypothetical protein [Microbacterium oryzae]|uniref:hypothetical protein n=1 Tax=Microbacterium oryzae TaxID=743009 RepID=UPI0012E19C88|nr:hypothetical protein [Microbacterium oryzae]
MTVMFTGVPFGAQVAWLSIMSTGCPPALTRIDADVQVAVTHGMGLVPVMKGQPEIVCGVGWVVMG